MSHEHFESGDAQGVTTKRRDSLLTYAARREHISDSADISTTTMVEEFIALSMVPVVGFYPIFAALYM